MVADWRAALDRALAASGTSISTLRLLAGEGTLARDWLADDQRGRPTAAEYLSLSDLTEIEVEVLTGEVEPTSTLAVAMRSRGQTAPQVTLERSVKLLRVARAVLRLESGLGRLEQLHVVQAMFSTTTTSSTAAVSGKNAARQMRARLRLETAPILDMPSLIEALGVAVEFTTDLPSGLHGVTSWTETSSGWIASIAINANDRWTVQRYSLAHEFCHVLHQDRPTDLTTELGDARISSDPTESRAEAFATHFLAPRVGLAEHWSEARLTQESQATAAARVMWQWGISREAACYALEDCARIHWSAAQTEAVKALNVAQMMRDAGLEADWAVMTATQGSFEPSVWLTEATAGLFLDSRLPVENYAVVSNQAIESATAQLLQSV